MLPEFQALFQGDEHQPYTLRGDARAALLVHGFPGTPAEMRRLADYLHGLGWTVQALLLPGFGTDIETLPQRTAEEWHLAIATAYAELRRDYDAVLLVGLSMGGALALSIAAQQPPDALVLLAPFWRIEHLLWRALPVLKYAIPRFKPFRLFTPDFDDPDTRASMRQFMPDVDLDDPDVRKGILDLTVPVGMMDQVRVAGQRGYQAATQVTCPALVIQGNQDDLVQPTVTRQLVARLAGPVDYVEVADGHELIKPHARDWASIQRALDQFLLKHNLGDTNE